MDPPSKTFVDVCFVLIGFDPSEEHKVRFRMVHGGGFDAGQYSQNCTHVIVDKTVYDDPVCVAARKDGKILVTRLWVDHSFDVGMPVDASSIMYRPPRGLAGIPGAKTLIICLTGYDRQDRQDIMTMVGIMGAQFSKPLVASKVTHLICYRFEGEKYELAKRTRTIRLVNHRWLEDCLTNWELLPEANYTKSGFELELMEAEAKDSEDEDEDSIMKQTMIRNVVRSPHNLKTGTVNACEDFIAEMEAPLMLPKSIITEDTLKAARPSAMVSTPSRASRPDQVSGSDGTSVLVQDGCKETSTSGTLSGCLPDKATPKSSKVHDNLASTSKNSEWDSGSDVIFYSRKRPRKLSSTKSVERASGSLDGSASSSGHKLETAGAYDSSCLAEHAMQVVFSAHLDTSNKIGKSNTEESPCSLPQERAEDVSAVSIKYQKTEEKSRAYMEQRSLVKCKGQGQPLLLGEDNDLIFSKDGCKMDDTYAQNSSCRFTTSKCSNSNEKLAPDDLPNQATLTFQISDKKVSEIFGDTAQPADVTATSEDQRSNLKNRKSATDKSVAEKTVGLKANLKSAACYKGFVYSRRTSVRDGSLTSSSKRKVTALHESNGALEISHLTLGFEASEDAVSRIESDLVARKTDPANGKTEAPENKDELEVTIKSNHDVLERVEEANKEPRSEAQIVINDLRHGVLGDAEGSKEEKKGTEHVKLVSTERSLDKGKKRCSSKDEVKTRSNAGVMKISKDIASSDGCQDKKVRGNTRKKNQKTSRPSNQVGNSGSVGTFKKIGCCEEMIKDMSSGHGKNKGLSLGTIQGRTAVNKSAKSSKNLKKKSSKAHIGEEPVWFILSGHRLQRKEFGQVLRCLKGRVCRDSHQWSYQATHFITPELKRTEKVFAAAASGRWILKSDYLAACNEAGNFLREEPYEWHKNGLNEDGSINLEAPRLWRLHKEKTGHGAFYGMNIVVYGDFIIPSLDTLKRVVKAGDGTILATSPPYTRFLDSGIDYAVVSPATPFGDTWIQEFIRHEIPCVLADYLVDYVCKPGYSLDKFVLYKTHAWAQRSLSKLQSKVH